MSQHYSIKCPSCAAPLSLIGGGRVQSVVCNYCKSLIELGDEYKVLSDFKNVEVPDLPFKIGMQGKIKDVEWTIIGWILYRSYDEWDDKWGEFLLFSPLYGYGWLIYESGVISFSKRVRDFNVPEWEASESSSTIFYRKGHYLLKEMPYRSVIEFVQGELNWIAKRDDKIECWDYKGTQGAMLNIEKSNNELEVYHTERLDAKEVYESFGVKEEDQTIKKQSITEQLQEEKLEQKGFAFYGIVLIALMLFGVIFASFSSKTLLSQKIDSDITLPFTVLDGGFLHEIILKSKSNSDLDNYQITLYRDKKELLYIDDKRATLNHKKFDKTWNYHAIGAEIYLKLSKGVYQLKAVKTDKKITTPLHITVKERVIKKGYILSLFVLILLFLYYLSHRGINKVVIAVVGIVVTILAFFLSEGDDDD